MPIHEKSLIEADRLVTTDQLVVDGIDVSGHWNTMILPRYISDYDTGFQSVIQAYGGGERVHRCWQCGSCTNSCTMYAMNTQFNPRYWIYLVNLGLREELLKDKDIIWQCVSCNKCTHICPKDVRPEGVMKAIQHWMEDEGHVPPSPSTRFDAEFTRQCLARGRIEDSEVMFGFLREMREDVVALLRRGWLGIFLQRLANVDLLRSGRIGAFLARLPVTGPLRMGWAMLFKPRTRSWGTTGDVLRRYVEEQKRLARSGIAGGAAGAGFGTNAGTR